MGNKAILMSIQPRWVAEILNGNKTVEIRKRFPKDYVGWVYIYCTKAKPNAHIWTLKVKEKPYKVIFSKTQMQQERDLDNFMNVEFIEKYPQYAGERIICHPEHINGYVVARFWCDKVEEIYLQGDGVNCWFGTDSEQYDTEDETCVEFEDLENYLGYESNYRGYAIHISKLEVFEKPKELKELYKVGAWKVFEEQFDSSYLKREQQEIMEELGQTITKAPQSWCYIEGE